MPISSEYYERILDAIESSESAFEAGDTEEAAAYMEEVRAIAVEFLEEMEDLREEEMGEMEDFQETGEEE
jgi:hypothetical protein